MRRITAFFLCLASVFACDRTDTDTSQGSVADSVDLRYDPRCAMPNAPVVIREEDGAVLLSWEFQADSVLLSSALPPDSTFRAYRDAMVWDGADLSRPVADAPTPETEAQAQIWIDEHFNNDLAFSGKAGTIEPVSCLDALLFTWQARRIPPIEVPTEFLASVLRRPTKDGEELAVIFGAGAAMFPPRWAYGLDVVDRYLNDGWSYWYALHNHTPQSNRGLLALGVPVPSTSDVGFARALGEEKGMQFTRVTNGFYTFSGSVKDLAGFRAR